MAPEQVRVVPISEKYLDYANRILEVLKQEGISALIDDRNEKVGYKMRDVRMLKIPYAVIVGQQEMENGTVSAWNMKAGDKGTTKLFDFIEEVREDINAKSLAPKA